MNLVLNLLNSLQVAFFMFWQIFWPLVLGFILSAIVQTVVSHKRMAEVLGNDSARCYTIATFFGVASSSCSYAAVALARSIFKKGATFTSAMIFELASTNLVIELGLILLVLLGWQFALAEYLGGIVMVVIIALIFRFTLSKHLVSMAKSELEKDLQGKMEGHAHMDMSLEEGGLLTKIFSKKGLTAISHYFMMDITSVWFDVILGLIIAGLIAVFVPAYFWQTFFLKNNPQFSFIEGPLIGPLIAVLSFVCSVGNIPLASILWKEGISFGGVVSFIFADLIVLPILDIYRKYYGFKVMAYILLTFYITMVLAGYVVELLFTLLNIIPSNRDIIEINTPITFNYTFIFNIIAVGLVLFLVFRFLKTGGVQMLKMMNMHKHTTH